MVNLLFLTLARIEDITQRGIYTDLIREVAKKGINVYVVCPREHRENLPTELECYDNIHILKVKIGNITKTKSIIAKGISTLKLEHQYIRAIKENFKNVKFDAVTYSTPPITFNKIIKYFKKRDDSFTYLMLKDIFPQNAVDLGMIKESSLIHKLFKIKEKKLYQNSDVIGCMSEGNLEYIKKQHDFLVSKKLEIFPNAINPIKALEMCKKNNDILKKYNISNNQKLFIYGGNLGKPQGVDFIIDVINNFYKVKNGYLMIVGDGTEFDKIKKAISKTKSKNVSIYNKLPKDEYDLLLSVADVGLIFLDRRFTIPNFPSRLTSYMENSLPILAATDVNTDLKDVLELSASGFWSESSEVDTFITQAINLTNDDILRKQMGKNSRKYLEENYDVRKTVDILLKNLINNGDEENV